ncbi:hypothetical protein SEPCBS119000_004339 [Sporothrix epigloea]|uniref:EamA domain-containing protein n=1 Tax=Sporothrix epigloea TaxID=1892477 RepID=A0ABP0DUH2_9PEZI
MAPARQPPQQPSDKADYIQHVREVAFASDRSESRAALNPPPPPLGQTAHAEDMDRYRHKSVSPAPSHLHPHTGNDTRLGYRLGLSDDAYHRISIGSMSDAGYGPIMGSAPYRPYSPHASAPIESLASAPLWARIWDRNKAVLLVFGSQFFGALMNLFARLLELESEHSLHPVQLLFVRQVMTTIGCCLYALYYPVPHFPLGPFGLRWLLVLRGLTGFFGIFGVWYSMMYLPLAEATVFTFLVPSVSSYICYILLKEPFTRKEQIASVVALLGVILITQPLSLSSSSSSQTPYGIDFGVDDAFNATGVAEPHNVFNTTTDHSTIAAADSGRVPTLQRLLAIGVALLGVLGTSCAFTTIRAIGTRVDPLISVNYFATSCVFVTGSILTIAPMLDFGQPALRFAVPHSFRQCVLLLLICVCGFATQFLATKGLGLERSNRATAMVYTHMLFAAGFDRFVFGHEMGPTSLVGCGLIIGSALWAALSKKPTSEDKGTSSTEMAALSTAMTATGTDLEIGALEARGAENEAAPMLGADADADADAVVEDNGDSRSDH